MADFFVLFFCEEIIADSNSLKHTVDNISVICVICCFFVLSETAVMEHIQLNSHPIINPVKACNPSQYDLFENTFSHALPNDL